MLFPSCQFSLELLARSLRSIFDPTLGTLLLRFRRHRDERDDTTSCDVLARNFLIDSPLDGVKAVANKELLVLIDSCFDLSDNDLHGRSFLHPDTDAISDAVAGLDDHLGPFKGVGRPGGRSLLTGAVELIFRPARRRDLSQSSLRPTVRFTCPCPSARRPPHAVLLGWRGSWDSNPGLDESSVSG